MTLTHMRYRNLPHMPGGEYVLHRDYSTIPSTLILCRVLARCHHVRDALDSIHHQPLLNAGIPSYRGLPNVPSARTLSAPSTLPGSPAAATRALPELLNGV